MNLKIICLLVVGYSNCCGAGNNTESELRTRLFQNYKLENRPVLNFNETVTSSFGVEVISLEEFDQVGEKVKFNFQMKFTWYDEFLRWNRTQFDFNYLNIKPEYIWRPDLELYNSANKPEKINGEGILKVWHTGQVYWIIPIIYDYSCPLSLGEFPFDTQKCIMTFGSWKQSQNYLNISTYPLNFPKSLVPYTSHKNRNPISLFPPVKFDSFKHNEWNIVKMDHFNNNLEYLCCPGELWTITEIHIIMERNYHKYIVVIIMTFFLTCSALAVSSMVVERYIRTYLLVFIPLSIIWLQLYISSKIPVIEYSTKMENFIQLSFYICMISAIYSGIMYNIAIKPIQLYNGEADSRIIGNRRVKKSVWIRKKYDEGTKFYLDSIRWGNLFFNFDNFFRIGLVVVYFSWTLSIVL